MPFSLESKPDLFNNLGGLGLRVDFLSNLNDEKTIARQHRNRAPETRSSENCLGPYNTMRLAKLYTLKTHKV